MKGKVAQPSKVLLSEHHCLQNFILPFMALSTALVAKNLHILAGIYFSVLRKSLRPNDKGFQYQFWTSMKRSEEILITKQDKF